MEITLYNFSKRRNSTKVPTSDNIIAVKDVVLKNECSLVTPSFFLTGFDNASYIKAWNNYYFITNRYVDINGAQYIECRIDFLATWKTHILGTTAFVKYSSSDYSLMINDDRVTPIQDIRNLFSEQTEGAFFKQHDNYLCTVAGQDGIDIYFCETYANVDRIFGGLMLQTQAWATSTDVALSDAVSAIISVRSVPFARSQLTLADKHVYLGNLDLNIGDMPALTGAFRGLIDASIGVPIPRQYTDFRKGSKYTTFKLYLPFIGSISLSPDDFLDTDRIGVYVTANVITGQLLYSIYNDDYIVATYSGSFGRDIPVSNIALSKSLQSAVTFGGAASTAFATGVAIGFGAVTPIGAIAGIGSSIASATASFIQSKQESVSVIGGYSGSFGEMMGTKITLLVEEQETNIEPSNLTVIAGNPCLKVRSMEGLTGYVETVGFSIDISATDNIRETINTMMDSGVYLE